VSRTLLETVSLVVLGIRLVLLYHHDGADCHRAIPQYAQMAHGLSGKEVRTIEDRLNRRGCEVEVRGQQKGREDY